jgi:hypothetical protein
MARLTVPDDQGQPVDVQMDTVSIPLLPGETQEQALQRIGDPAAYFPPAGAVDLGAPPPAEKPAGRAPTSTARPRSPLLQIAWLDEAGAFKIEIANRARVAQLLGQGREVWGRFVFPSLEYEGYAPLLLLSGHLYADVAGEVPAL